MDGGWTLHGQGETVRNRPFLRQPSLPLRCTVRMRPQPVSTINVAQPAPSQGSATLRTWATSSATPASPPPTSNPTSRSTPSSAPAATGAGSAAASNRAPKSDAGFREVPLAPLVVEAIRRQLPPGADLDVLVFTGPGGGNGVPIGSRTILSRHGFRRLYQSAVRRAGADLAHLQLRGPHDLRHTFSTWSTGNRTGQRASDTQSLPSSESRYGPRPQLLDRPLSNLDEVATRCQIAPPRATLQAIDLAEPLFWQVFWQAPSAGAGEGCLCWWA